MTKILVTGGAGYIGSNVVSELCNDNEVAIVDNLSTGHRRLINPKAKFFETDLLDLNALTKIFNEVRPEIVFHFGGVSQVGESNKDPKKYRQINVTGGRNLLEAMASAGCKKIIFSSSAAVYGEPTEIPITEDHPLKPISVYGETKMEFEKMLDEFDRSHKIKYVALRYFNAGGASEDGRYGEIHDPETHLIPNILKAIKHKKEFFLFGDDYPTKDGTCVRDYIHVHDLAHAHILAMGYLAKNDHSQKINLGSSSGYSVKEMVDICEKVTGQALSPTISPRRPGDPAVLIASNEKAKKVLGWTPKKSIRDIVESAWRFEKLPSLSS